MWIGSKSGISNPPKSMKSELRIYLKGNEYSKLVKNITTSSTHQIGNTITQQAKIKLRRIALSNTN
ncbi:hypothetical protein ACQKGD_25515 [Peribacillus frigoritolerans]|uniref:hypothetical protein n=1 Tax=Peribacillus frigoritolerans TaxID=450367 RepID=UPI0020798D08|nr:hypothetical protein [Peribacillus frigoritolerans]USK68126.1 hypothetical protein LIT26_30255 [Peribacillus frigoritolerans]